MTVVFSGSNYCQGHLLTSHSIPVVQRLRWSYTVSYNETPYFVSKRRTRDVYALLLPRKIRFETRVLWVRPERESFCAVGICCLENPTNTVVRIQARPWFLEFIVLLSVYPLVRLSIRLCTSDNVMRAERF